MNAKVLFALLLFPVFARADDGDAYRKVVDSVVWIVAVDHAGNRLHGTGVVVDDGILTAYHVVKGRRLFVVFPARDQAGLVIGEAAHYTADSSRHYQAARLVHGEPARDLAFLRLKVAVPMKPATLSNRTVGPGEHVFSIGGDGVAEWRYSSGSVRQIRCHSYGRAAGVKYVESSLPLNDGDSGGALFDARGEVVAINSSSSKELSLVNQSVDIAEIREFLRAAKEKK